uniref:Fungal lipase-type domain-containing protein n=1 Tax=Trieres chinensis TaxID=1514140 RepID=A0A7S1YYV1_TRICV|mmetsp:Transcript_13746/g.28283  ORF Transcript_13746/g.28283 Transcript_13746/m.28283 type:complete len:487 (+) Transcript_13746:126-1586(+)|eukprot:CAMPEP_0183303172 /NCGR_PEP_ID=MMETSP0160_2-20130417/8707_1 /TAXON_ID=2839 ORGANISM="Odontella Sinensis, Strain Grunow 1884" /NCGR_SAMPLE_ID=MMETSP0160_2 /ASSEMBLY_ACC=CAM_ASM_000250 /LENGTH=486 /DNA_ID=CAMNT_0025466043 /DNA_START=65 /DNA_END=1525 /DNA_ORIENTATION=-
MRLSVAVPLVAVLASDASAAKSVVLSENVMSLVRDSAYLSNQVYYPEPSVQNFNDPHNYIQEPDQALVAKHNGYCFGVFRGTTMSWDDWSQNLDPGKVDACVPDPSDNTKTECCTTRKGFYEAYMTSYRDDIEKELLDCAKTCSNPDECVVLTGHSQGGAIAALAGIYLAELNPYVITFGQPLTLEAPCDLVTSERWYRFVNTKVGNGISYDPIPFVPAPGADYFGHMVILGDEHESVSFIGLDAQDSFGPPGPEAHSMEGSETAPGYLPRISKLMVNQTYPIATYGWPGGHPCTQNKECQSNNCAKETRYANKLCVATDCRVDSDCGTGRCDSGLCKPKLGSCMKCDEDSDCAGGKCLLPLFRCSGDGGLMDDKCVCRVNSDCESGRCEGLTPPTCEAQLGAGARCNEDSDCRSKECTWLFRCAEPKIFGTMSASTESNTKRIDSSKMKGGIVLIGVVVIAGAAQAGYKIWRGKRAEYEAVSMDV